MKFDRRLIYYAVALVVAIILPIGRDVFTQHLLVLSLIFAVYALSYDIIIGHMGQLSFGHQAFFGLGGYTTGLCTVNLGLSLWVSLLASLLVCAVLGFIIGYISLRTRGVYLGLVTLGFALLIWMTVVTERYFTGGSSGVRGIPPVEIAIPLLPKVAFDTPLPSYYLVLAILLLTIYFISRLLRSRFGKALIAIRENEDRASSLGINAFRYYLIAFTIAAIIGGLSGFVYCRYVCYIGPGALSILFLWAAVIMVIVGGTGTLMGPVIGAFIYVFVPEFFRIAEELRFIFFGAILVAVIIFLPRGIYPALVSLWDRFVLRRRERNKAEAE